MPKITHNPKNAGRTPYPYQDQKHLTINNFQKHHQNLDQFLKDYYGQQLQTKVDLKEKACCSPETSQKYGETFKLLPKEVTEKHYGCGVPIPEDELGGLTVLDLGSGAGVDAFIMSRKVGPTGFVHGVDMTPEQVYVSNRNIPLVMKNFGFPKLNVKFHLGFIETADAIPDNSIDLVISDCVINLSPKKDLVLKTIHRVLKPGGEFYISDVYSDRRVPEEFQKDPVLVAECLDGAEYLYDWNDLVEAAGFRDPRIVSKNLIQDELKGNPISFWSVTQRGFKFSKPLDRRCEDYGQLAIYKGNIPGSSTKYVLDDHHVFEAHRPAPVCMNTARMLDETRLSKYFEVTSPIRHFGLFPCGPVNTGDPTPGACGPEGCC